MKKTKYIILLFLFLTFSKLFAQETVSINEIYIDNNNIAHKVENDEKFTGFAQKTRKNGHIIYEDEFENGIILVNYSYFNSSDKRLAGKMIYNQNKPFVFEKFIEYKSNKNADWQEIKSYDQNGIKILEETITDGKTTYRCEFLNGKKHGTEFCIKEDGSDLIIEYKNGKKVK